MEHQVPSQSFLAAISALPCRFVGPKQRQSDWFIDFVSFFSARADISMACRQICQCQCQCLVVCSDEEAGQKLETDSTRRFNRMAFGASVEFGRDTRRFERRIVAEWMFRVGVPHSSPLFASWLAAHPSPTLVPPPITCIGTEVLALRGDPLTPMALLHSLASPMIFPYGKPGTPQFLLSNSSTFIRQLPSNMEREAHCR